MGGRIVVVGLGPAGDDLLLPAARAAIVAGTVRFVRTARHPAVDDLRSAGITFTSFDDEYERGATFDAVYGAMVDRLLAAAAAAGTATDDGVAAGVVYAVPGNPAVAERTVTLLREAAVARGVTVDVIPGLSFAELAWARLGVDAATGGARILDAHAVTTDGADVSGALLIVQCDTTAVLSDVKLHLLDALDGTTPVTVLQRLGLPSESVRSIELAELDRSVDPDHLTSVFVDTGVTPVGGDFARFVQLMETLRGPGGCPWDAEQTHASLRRYALEEAYEVVEAIGRLPVDAPGGLEPGAPPPEEYAALADELGDLLCQVVFHAVLAREAGAFTVDDVVRGIHAKLVRRHPHVFAPGSTAAVDDGAAVMRSWEQIKKEEKAAGSLVEGITPELPSLLYTLKLFRKAASIGLVVDDPAGARTRAELALARLPDAPAAEVDAVVGELLAAVVVLARGRGTDAESALRGWAVAYRERFEAMERAADAAGVDLAIADPRDVAALWVAAAPATRS